jgi:hypothetical protein
MPGESANPYRLPCNFSSWPTRKTLTFCTQHKHSDEQDIPAQCNETDYGASHSYVAEGDCTGTWRAGNCYGDCTNSTATGLVTDSSAHTVGTTTILFDGLGSGELLPGDLLKFEGDDYGYLVTTGFYDMSVSGAFAIITPGLFNEVAPSTPVSVIIKTTRDYSLCHKQGHKVVRARKAWHGAASWLSNCDVQCMQDALATCLEDTAVGVCVAACSLSESPEYCAASCVDACLVEAQALCVSACNTDTVKYRRIDRQVTYTVPGESAVTIKRSTTVDTNGVLHISEATEAEAEPCNDAVAGTGTTEKLLLWAQWQCGPQFPYADSGDQGYALNMLFRRAMAEPGMTYSWDFTRDGTAQTWTGTITTLSETTVAFSFTVAIDSDTWSYDATWVLSLPYALSEVIGHAFDLADSWNLADDIQYPWMAYGYESSVAGYHNPVPMVEIRELTSGVSPDVLDYVCSTFPDPYDSAHDGAVIGEPLPHGTGVHYAYWDEAGTVAARGWNPGLYTLPETATWWTKPYSPGAPENSDCDISDWPSGGWVKVSGGMVTVQKWAQTRETVPSLNLFGPCGADRDHASFPDAWPICGRAKVASVSGTGTISVVLSEAAPYLRTGDAVDFVTYDGSFVETVTDNNKTVTVTDEKHFTFTGATPTGTHIKSHDAPHYRWYDNKPKGDALFCKSEYNFCDLSTATTCIPDCTRFSPCYPQVMAILTDTPAETAWVSKNNIAIQNLPTAPEFNGGVQYIVQAHTEDIDPYWTGEEADNPGVESRCEMPTTPTGAPTLPNYAYTYVACSGGLARPARGLRGLGDAVALVAQPIAITIDAATSMLPKRLRTNISGCGGCQKRKAALNKAVPFKT